MIFGDCQRFLFPVGSEWVVESQGDLRTSSKKLLAEAEVKLIYDKNDLPHAKKLRDERFTWLLDLGATELSEVPLSDEAFLFAYQHGDEHYQQLVADRPNVFDRPEQRQELVRLEDVLQRLDKCGPSSGASRSPS